MRLPVLRKKKMLNNREIIACVTESDLPSRLDAFLASAAQITRSYAAKLIEDGCVGLNGSVPSKSSKLKLNDTVTCTIPEAETLNVEPQDIPLDIIYEDSQMLVVNKPKGMVVHPAAGNYSGTLVNALLYHCAGELSGINGVARPGIVHRIDKDTSGLLMVAKTDEAHLSLSEQIKDHSFTREYRAVVYGNIKEDKGVINAPIGRHKTLRKQMTVIDENSKNAVTHFEVIERFEKFTYLKLRLETGRTHQIRVHMAYIGHPVAGDPVYGPKKVITELGGQCLHAAKIGFVHPKTGEYMEFGAENPKYFTDFLKKISDNINL